MPTSHHSHVRLCVTILHCPIMQAHSCAVPCSCNTIHGIQKSAETPLFGSHPLVQLLLLRPGNVFSCCAQAHSRALQPNNSTLATPTYVPYSMARHTMGECCRLWRNLSVGMSVTSIPCPWMAHPAGTFVNVCGEKQTVSPVSC